MTVERRQAGFTLIELLVAMAAGMVVIGGVVTILVSTLSQTALMTSRIAATRATRVALSNIENELHSACVGTGTAQNLAPIQAGSNANTLIFVSFLGTTINPSPTWHVLTYTPGADTLTDASYAANGSNGSWTQGAAQGTTTVLTDVTAQPGTDFFQYFAYQSYPIANSANSYWTIPTGTDVLPDGTTPAKSTLGDPLTSTSASSVVEVLITLEGFASTPSGEGSQTAGDPETDAVSLRLTDPPNEAPSMLAGSYGPCE